MWPGVPAELTERDGGRRTDLFADDLSLVLVDELEQRDDHRQTEAADENVENAGDVAERQRAL